MTAWWEKAYPGGPLVAVRGFPRPLYPGDSMDGPDVEAYKRTVSRAGRWQWQAFDQAYSNAFAHGKGPNVIDTGIAGVQRQQKIEPTGNIGQKTFNTLRSIRIPAPLAHAGEMAMDARAVELVNAAWDRFQGEEPTYQPGDGMARLERAATRIGDQEDPPHSNQCEYTDWYGMVGPWCAMFVTWADQTGAAPCETFLQGVSYAYVPYVVSDARLSLNGLSVTSSPKPGDLVCFDWSWDGEFDHIGIVDSPPNPAGDFTAIEGNTSTSDNSNGGQVMRRSRNRFSQSTVFVKVG